MEIPKGLQPDNTWNEIIEVIVSFTQYALIHCGLVTPHDDMDLDQHLYR